MHETKRDLDRLCLLGLQCGGLQADRISVPCLNMSCPAAIGITSMALVAVSNSKAELYLISACCSVGHDGSNPLFAACPARYGPSRGNYGGLPQTWSNSNVSDAVTGFPGDNDPLDVLDISSTRAPIGGVYRVKVIDCMHPGWPFRHWWTSTCVTAHDQGWHLP